MSCESAATTEPHTMKSTKRTSSSSSNSAVWLVDRFFACGHCSGGDLLGGGDDYSLTITRKMTDKIEEDDYIAYPPPTLYDDIVEMFSGAVAIYLFADLRDLARKGKAEVDLELPIDLDHVVEQIQSNRKLLVETSESQNSDLETTFRTLETINGGGAGKGKDKEEGRLWDDFIVSRREFGRLVEFKDSNANNPLVHEMVYAIDVNDERRRITVTFRGNTTVRDFITDARVAQTKVASPVRRIEAKSPDAISIHCGFYKYLFHQNRKKRSLFHEILSSVLELLRANNGYQLYCNGHSLGGALCTIFGFYAATNDEVYYRSNSPVRVYSVASPYVGNENFLCAFQALERQERVQHLRIANAEDIVTLLPFASPKLGMLPPIMAMKNGMMNSYAHCGMKLHLTEKSCCRNRQRYQFVYARDKTTEDQCERDISKVFEDPRNLFSSLRFAVCNKDTKKVKKYHSGREYEDRLKRCREELQRITLNNVYQDKDIVGDVLEPDYEPEKIMLTATTKMKRIANSMSLKRAFKRQLRRTRTDCRDEKHIPKERQT